MKPDTLPHGAPFVIGAAIVAALKAAFEPDGVRVLDNPQRANDLMEGARVIFFEDQSDKLIEQTGGVAKRTYTFGLGVINRSTAPRFGAHADYRAAKRVVRGCMPAILAAGVEPYLRGLIEGDVTYRLENIDVGGGLVLGLFTLDYRDPG